MQRLFPWILLAAGVVCLTACGSSETSAELGAVPATATAATSGRAVIDYNNPPDLEAALRIQWNQEMADPKHAHYAPGVRVKDVLCTRDIAPHSLRCRMTPTRGAPSIHLYRASKDGHRFVAVGFERER
jgi:hypothetical protein